MLERVLAALIITVVTASGAVASSENPKGSLPAQGLGEYSTYREALLGNSPRVGAPCVAARLHG